MKYIINYWCDGQKYHYETRDQEAFLRTLAIGDWMRTIQF